MLNIISGTITNITHGSPKTITLITVKVFKQATEVRMTIPITMLSISLMSVENLFIIRPRGVLSNHQTGARITVSIISLWKILEARREHKSRTAILEAFNTMVKVLAAMKHQKPRLMI
mmetsp:Transcript_39072/g.57428  ORF Transcript_39072/g.57428 Transcript_39072/m.57428 type:complete len:118 (-) Transcript_39072:269-622(-)